MSATDCGPPDRDSARLLEDEIRDLEAQLARAKVRLKAQSTGAGAGAGAVNGTSHDDTSLLQNTTTHFLLLLADSALPLGSFAFSSGLESYLAHARLNPFSPSTASPSFDLFLPLSIASYASTTLPFLLAAHRDPARLAELDDALDAAVVCTVGKRASVAQGRALLGLWERSFASSSPLALPSPHSSSSSSSSSAAAPGPGGSPALESLASFARLLRMPARGWDAAGLPPAAAAHLAPLFGVVAAALGLGLRQAAYVFVLGHVKALVSAAVRASVMGPYAAQGCLASGATQAAIRGAIDREWGTPPEEAGQAVPAMDLWVGRHELLYSRIFNS